MTTTATDPKRRALGKGLDSLLPRVNASAAPAPTSAVPVESEAGRPREIPLDQIDPNPFQTRSRINEDTLAELAAEVSRQSGKTIVYNDLSEAAFTDVLTGAGLPADLAALLADADAAASRGALFDDSGALGRLIGRPTTSMESVVAAALRS